MRIHLKVETNSRWELLPLPCQQTTAYINIVHGDASKNKRANRQQKLKKCESTMLALSVDICIKIYLYVSILDFLMNLE